MRANAMSQKIIGRMWRSAATLVSLGCAAAAARAEDIKLKGMLERPPSITYTSGKSIGALEECFGIALSGRGIPTALHGDHKSIISTWTSNAQSFGVLTAVTLTQVQAGTLVEVRMRAPGLLGDPWGDSARAAAASCR